MIDFFEKIDFNQTVYLFGEEPIELGELALDYAEDVCSPKGIEKKMHTRGCELWTWGFGGQNPELVESFDTEAEAEHALMLCHLFDLENNDNVHFEYK